MSVNNSIVVRTHDPLTGKAGIRFEPSVHPHAEAISALIKEKNFQDAVEISGSSDTLKVTIRPLPRSPQAAVKIAADLYTSNVIDGATAIGRVYASQFFSLLEPKITNLDTLTKCGSGLAASPGIATGRVAMDAESAIDMAKNGDQVILFVTKTTPEDMEALNVVRGIVTTSGGFTSHSAVVARQMGKPCVVSVAFEKNASSLTKGESLTVDGATGTVYRGVATFEQGVINDDMVALLKAADEAAKLKVFTNADTGEDLKVAIANGAKGVGLCRTEHTFFTATGTHALRMMILAKNPYDKSVAVNNIKNIQIIHFESFFKELNGLPATIRLLDPPLHEFLPRIEDKDGIIALAKAMHVKTGVVKARIEALHEENPMLGHRGCRLAITTPGLYEAQTAAIVRAAMNVKYTGEIGIMIPLVIDPAEMIALIKNLRDAANSVFKGFYDDAPKPTVTFGAMLETPRACLFAYKLAEVCDFFSFGTNDLTQATWALSRDDGMKFIPAYIEQGLIADPFLSLDIDGVGALMAHAVESLKERRSKVKIGICGEHGGDPKSIAFCNALGLDYVSCSPPRVLGARMAAAHAAVGDVKPFASIEVDLTDTFVKKQNIAKALPDLATVIPPPPPIGPVKSVPTDLSAQFKAVLAAEKAAVPFVVPAPPPKPMAPLPKVPFANMPSWPAGPLSVPSDTSWYHAAQKAMKELVDKQKGLPIEQFTKALAGLKVGIQVKAGQMSPKSGVVVGYVGSGTGLNSLVALAVQDPLGHDGKVMKKAIKYAFHPPQDTQLWYAGADCIVPLP